MIWISRTPKTLRAFNILLCNYFHNCLILLVLTSKSSLCADKPFVVENLDSHFLKKLSLDCLEAVSVGLFNDSGKNTIERGKRKNTIDRDGMKINQLHLSIQVAP